MKKHCVNIPNFNTVFYLIHKYYIENITIIINNFDGFENVFQVINNCILV